jgi:hypothetical protein
MGVEPTSERITPLTKRKSNGGPFVDRNCDDFATQREALDFFQRTARRKTTRMDSAPALTGSPVKIFPAANRGADDHTASTGRHWFHRECSARSLRLRDSGRTRFARMNGRPEVVPRSWMAMRPHTTPDTMGRRRGDAAGKTRPVPRRTAPASRDCVAYASFAGSASARVSSSCALPRCRLPVPANQRANPSNCSECTLTPSRSRFRRLSGSA